ncbi:hypothetical protein CHUAL_005558 [Chamberlinius hualienensis]
MAINSKEPENIEWNVDMEVQLFYAMRGHKPVGVNRHFQMACIIEKFRNAVQKDITSQHLWDHLDSMYDMVALHESEIIPFPNDETDFSLPESILGENVKKEGKKEDDKSVSKTKESTRDEKETVNTSGKQTSRERSKETREIDADSHPSNSPKRKRQSRHQQESNAKPHSPASTTSTSSKRRRT